MTDDPPVFLSWIRFHQRSEDLAAALGAEAVYVAHGQLRLKWSTPVRYVRQLVDTHRFLRRRRPPAVFVMAPPLLPTIWARLVHGRRARIVVDAHSKAVRRVGSEQVRWSFRLLARLADVVIVTNEPLAHQAETAGATAVVCHDPIRPLVPVPNGPLPKGVGAERPVVLFPASWSDDEPLDAVVAAARLVSQARWVITGQPNRKLDGAPPNVVCTEFVSNDEYVRLVVRSAVILALTTREETMQRAGYDALRFARPLVASGTYVLRNYFGDAARYCDVDGSALAASLAEAVQATLNDHGAATRMAALRDERLGAQDAAIQRILEAAGLTGG